MTTFRSSVRPKSSKQPWGTILHPEFGLGYQKLTSYELEQTVDRLSRPAQRRETVHPRVQQADLDRYGIKAMVGPTTSDICHMIRITRIRYGFWRILSDMAVLRFDTDFNKIYGIIIFKDIMACMRHRTILHNGILVYC